MATSFTSLHVHMVFSTKHRAGLIDDELQGPLFQYIGGILRNEKSALVAAGGMSDHVHLLVSMGKELSVSAAVRLVKANSSKWVHEEFAQRHGFGWQDGYGAFAVSYSNLASTRQYIANQAEHHRTRTFQEEFVLLLEKHGIQYEPKYLWD
ncbi:MAG: IS200/IS605 family transposase [Pirellulales bacterium]